MINKDTLTGIIITIIIVLALFLSCKFLKYYDNRVENFRSEPDGNTRMSPTEKLDIKKTLNFKKVFETTKYKIWEAVPIDDYYPVGHYLTTGKNSSPPKIPAILVKTSESENDKPVRYTLVSSTGDDMGIWKPVPREGHASLGHIFSKEYPSRHIIRCPSREHLVPCNLREACVESKNYTIWNMERNGALFLAANNSNDDVPKDKPYRISLNKLSNKEGIKLKTTRKFKRLFDKKNTKLNQTITFWRPVCANGYVSTGDIVTTNKFNPNGITTVFTVSKEFTKYPKNFGKPLITLGSKRGNATIWKPEAPDGYICLGNVIVDGKNEPESNRIVGCVPLEYTTESNKMETKMVYNNIPSKNIFSIHKYPDTYLFKVVSGLDSKDEPNIVLNKNMMYLDKDCLDYPRDVVIHYELNPENTLNYNNTERDKYLVNTLSRRLQAAPDRFKNILFNTSEKKLNLTIDSRAANSEEMTVGELTLLLRKIILEDKIKIYSNDYKSHISTLTFIEVKSPKKNRIILDNSEFKSKKN